MFAGLIAKYALAGMAVLLALATAAAGVQTVRLAWFKESMATAMTEASEKARKSDKLNNDENRKVIDELLQKAAAADVAAASSAERLRQHAAARSPAAAACASNHETAAANLPDRTREDLESEADRADEVARQLAAAQAYITNVCRPAEP